MLKIDVYEFGSHTRARIHHHEGDLEARCNDSCDEYAVQRAYHQHGETVGEHRRAVAKACALLIMERSVGHMTFSAWTGRQLTLF